ncbi:hypothetical protein DFJ77DRAFT_417060, partial [Powellomyces hirtus]
AERILARTERPLMLQRRLFEQVGYVASDRIELLGREDNSYLCRFVFKEASPPDFWRSTNFSTSTVSLARMNLTAVPLTCYRLANDIVSFDLSLNPNVQEIPNDLAVTLESTRLVNMSRNELSKVPRALEFITTLSEINLSHNRIASLVGSGLENVPGLTKLYLAGNLIDHIPDAIPRGCQRLEILDLSNNRFRTFPVDLCHYLGKTLKHLDLNYCRIKDSIPDAIGDLVQLTVLRLAGNRAYGALPWRLGELQQLLELDLRGNSFGNAGGEEVMVMEVLSRCSRLETVLLDANRVRWILEIQSLKKLSLGSQFDPSHSRPMGLELSNITGSLAELDIGYCGIEFLPHLFFQRLPGLLKLNLSGNRLRDIPDFMPGPTSADSVKIPLRELYLSNNFLEYLPDDIGELDRLILLEIKGNNIRELPAEIWRCRSLKVLNVSSNRLESFPTPYPEDGTVLVPANNNVTFGRSGGFSFSTSFDRINGAMASSRSANRVDDPYQCENMQTQHNLPPLSHALEYLFLSDNNLGDDIYMALYHMPNLLTLHASFNEFTDITPWVVAIPLPVPMTPWFLKLQELHLSGNLISTLPGEIERIRTLKTLFLNGNKMSTVPGEVGKLKALEGLDLGSQVGGRGEGTGLRYNVSNWPYDWNWNWNLDLKYLNLSGNKRLEIKPSTTASSFLAGSDALPRDLTDFNALTNLRLLGLMDVTCLIVPPDESMDRRIRTTGSDVPMVGHSLSKESDADTFEVWDLVIPKFRGRDNEALFAVFDGKGTSGGAKMAKYLNEWFGWFLANELERVERAESAAHAELKRDAPRTGVESSPGAAAVRPLYGASAVVVFLYGSTLAAKRGAAKCTMYIANVGDGLAVMSKAGGTANRSWAHLPWPLSEVERVQSAGGSFSSSGYIEGEVPLTRAFGYFPVIGFVNADPWIHTVELEVGDDATDASRLQQQPMADNPEDLTDITAGKSTGGWGTAAMKVRDVALSLAGGQVGGGYLVMVLGLRDLAKKSTCSIESLNVDDRFRKGVVAGSGDVVKAPRRKGTEEVVDALTKEIAPPIGRLALVFTDIKNSTSIWENNPVAMRAALRLHHSVMRKLLRQTGGYEVKTEGDAFMVSFQNVSNAVEWCLTVQGELLNIDWPSEILGMADGRELIFKGLSVRMGIHFGNPLCEVDPITSRMDYYGPMVNRAARVTGASQGGQILISSDAMKELKKTLGWWNEESVEGDNLGDETAVSQQTSEEAARLKKLGIVTWCIGEVKLKGLETPEVIYAIYRRELCTR